MKKKRKKIKTYFGKEQSGCGVTGADCDGDCATIHGRTCVFIFKYKWEYHKTFKSGRRQVLIGKKDIEKILEAEKLKGKRK